MHHKICILQGVKNYDLWYPRIKTSQVLVRRAPVRSNFQFVVTVYQLTNTELFRLRYMQLYFLIQSLWTSYRNTMHWKDLIIHRCLIAPVANFTGSEETQPSVTSKSFNGFSVGVFQQAVISRSALLKKNEVKRTHSPIMIVRLRMYLQNVFHSF